MINSKSFDLNYQLLKDQFPQSIKIIKLLHQASVRKYYRLLFKKYSLIAMVYPQKNPQEINKIQELAHIYQSYGINVPKPLEIVKDRILIQQDLGDTAFDQHYIKQRNKVKEQLWEQIIEILLKLSSVHLQYTTEVLDNPRMKWEINFFLKHFYKNYYPGKPVLKIKDQLYQLVDKIININHFAHRDFHSQNILIFQNKLWLVDFQNSLQAPQFYDLVSMLFDSYLDSSEYHISILKRLNVNGYHIDQEQYFLTALQRNIKALGTFGYQVKVRGQKKYRQYIPKTIKDIRENVCFLNFF